MSAQLEWAFIAQCDLCGRRTTADVPDGKPCGYRYTFSEGDTTQRCAGTLRRRDVPRGDETEVPIIALGLPSYVPSGDPQPARVGGEP